MSTTVDVRATLEGRRLPRPALWCLSDSELLALAEELEPASEIAAELTRFKRDVIVWAGEEIRTAQDETHRAVIGIRPGSQVSAGLKQPRFVGYVHANGQRSLSIRSMYSPRLALVIDAVNEQIAADLLFGYRAPAGSGHLATRATVLRALDGLRR